MSILDLTLDLMRRRSVTPDDAGCQKVLAAELEKSGFVTTPLRFGPVDNLWARHGSAAPLFVFVGHTDVVPAGPREAWHSDPFEPEVRGEFLYGRGAADMKAALACMVRAGQRFVAAHPQHRGSIAYLFTSDEEGDATDGTVKVVEWLSQRGERIDCCLVGEPSALHNVGDVIKNGRRGSLTGKLVVHGMQGHVAYPQLADNPVHRALPALHALAQEVWDRGNADFPATSMQISNMHAGTGAANVIPGTLDVLFNFRFSTAVTPAQLQQRTQAILDKNGVRYDLNWQQGAAPFLTPGGALLKAVRHAVQAVTGKEPSAQTTGGTSDGRFIAPTGAEVVEIGPVNATIHKANECVRVSDLETLTDIYVKILEQILL